MLQNYKSNESKSKYSSSYNSNNNFLSNTVVKSKPNQSVVDRMLADQ